MSLSKNPTHTICTKAVIALLEKGTPIKETVRACTDIRDFVVVRTVAGGAHKDNVYLGKAVRFYYATDTRGTINYRKSKNKVPKSDNAKPLMELPDTLPADVDYHWYVKEAYNMLCDLGYAQITLF